MQADVKTEDALQVRTFNYYGDAEDSLRRAGFTYNALSATVGRMLYRSYEGLWVEVRDTSDHKQWNVLALVDEAPSLNLLIPPNPLQANSSPNRRRSFFV